MRLLSALYGLTLLSAHSQQIENLSANFSASEIYFTTTLQQRGLGQSAHQKIFLLRNNALTLIREGAAPTAIGGTHFLRTALDATGSIRAINSLVNCIGGSSCFFRELAFTELQTSSGPLQLPGRAAITANGRFAVLYGTTSSAPNADFPPRSLRRLDLQSGQVTLLGQQPAADGHMIAEDGSVIISGDRGIRLLGPSKTIDLTPAYRVIDRVLLAGDASRIVYQGSAEIRVIDVASNQDRLLAPGRLPMLAADGRRVSYLTETGELRLADALTGTTQPLFSTNEGIADQVLSGDGAAVIVATGTGRLLSVNTANGATTQLFDSAGPAIVLLASPSTGSYNELKGNFPENFPLDLRIDGQPVVLLSQTATAIAFQVPWEMVPSPGSKLILYPPEQTWERQLAVGLSTFGTAVLAAIHEDWSALIAKESPALPGETIHIFGAGYGPVDAPVETGKPTPADRLYRIVDPCQWQALGQYPARTIEVPFAGLAPGLIGIYQLDLRIPTDWPYPLFNAFCGDLRTVAIDVKP